MSGQLSLVNTKKLDYLTRTYGNQRTINEFSCHAQSQKRRLSKQIYNRQSRDVSKHARQWKRFKLKLISRKLENLEADCSKSNVREVYDQDKHLQLKFFSIHSQSKQHVSKCESAKQDRADSLLPAKLPPSVSSNNFNSSWKGNIGRDENGRKKSVKHNKKDEKEQFSQSFGKARRTFDPRQTILSSPYLLPSAQSKADWKFIKRRQMTDVGNSALIKFITQHNREITVLPKSTVQPLVNLTTDRMQRFVKHLHSLVGCCNTLDQDHPIPECQINSLIVSRYSLRLNVLQDEYDIQRKMMIEHSHREVKMLAGHQYALLHGLSKHSLINKVKQSRYKQSYAKNQSLIIEHAVKDNIYLKKSAEYQNNKHNGGQYDTKNLLADFDFISLKETRKSIHRLVNMSVFTTQKLAFTLYDRNHDGVIDRKDLIPLFNLVDTLPVLSGDISKMVRALTSLHKRRRNRTMAMHASVYEEPSLTNLPTKTQTSSARFDTRRFYSFFRSNEQESLNKHREESLCSGLDFSSFSEIFGGSRPDIFHDLIRFLFGISHSDYRDLVLIPASFRGSKQRVEETKYSDDGESIQEQWNKRLLNANEIIKKGLKFIPVQSFSS